MFELEAMWCIVEVWQNEQIHDRELADPERLQSDLL